MCCDVGRLTVRRWAGERIATPPRRSWIEVVIATFSATFISKLCRTIMHTRYPGSQVPPPPTRVGVGRSRQGARWPPATAHVRRDGAAPREIGTLGSMARTRRPNLAAHAGKFVRALGPDDEVVAAADTPQELFALLDSMPDVGRVTVIERPATTNPSTSALADHAEPWRGGALAGEGAG